VVAIAAGDLHSLALKSDGSLVTWGFNTSGQCVIPAGLTNIVAISARGKHSMVLTKESAPPELAIALSNATVVLSWPISATPITLEQNPDLKPGNWSVITNTPAVAGARNVIALPASGNMFFRLVVQ
jgi:hypothetical protein